MNLWLSKRGLTRESGALLRAGLLTLTALVLGVFAFSAPIYVAQLRTACSGSGCNADQLTAEGVRVLGELGFSVGEYAAYFGGLTIASALMWFGVATVIAWRRFYDWFAVFVALTLVLVGAFSITGSVDAGSSSWWLVVRAVNSLELACFMIFLSLFPDGRFVPRWTRWAALAAVVLGASFVLFPESPFGPLWFILSGSLVAAQVYRYRRVSGPVQRQQTKWVVSAVAVVILVSLGMFLLTEVFSSDVLGIPPGLVFTPLANVVLLAVPFSIGIAILRYRLFDIDLVISRVLVYTALTACVVAIYVLVVGYLGALLRTEGNLFISLLAAGLVAVLFQPLRERLQQGVNRLMYGERDDPYTVLSRLGEQLEATLDPQTALSTLVKTIAEALKLPYAAITLEHDGDSAIAAEHGSPPQKPVSLPLTYGSEKVGRLVLAPRPGEESFSAADERLLADLARQAGVLVHAVHLTNDLQRSREQLVSAREEERRRLRRDLHDGLGPRLAAQTLKLGSARSLYPRDPEAADALLSELEEDIESAVSEIRRLVYDLRPPALDDVGLGVAIREAAVRYATKDLDITAEIPQELPPLPAAVEVAAYRIAQEALTNVVHHAGASGCAVHLSVSGGALELEVCDDGMGLLQDRPAGVGLFSMRERAEELGGTCVIGPSAFGGVRVLARLPLPGEEVSGK